MLPYIDSAFNRQISNVYVADFKSTILINL